MPACSETRERGKEGRRERGRRRRPGEATGNLHLD
jgi:hypothetical protein